MNDGYHDHNGTLVGTKIIRILSHQGTIYPDEFPSSMNFLMVIPAINRYGYLQYPMDYSQFL